MIPATLSASAIQAYENCPAMFKAEYVDRVRISSPGGGAGDLGSAIHETLEWFVKRWTSLDVLGRSLLTFGMMADHFRTIAPSFGLNAKQREQAEAMIQAWFLRWQENPPDEVLLIEEKATFPLVVNVHGVKYKINVSYIFDRCDWDNIDDSPVVTDYKSWMQSLRADEIKDSIQFRIYVLAAASRFKDRKPRYVWICADQLRYGPTTVRFDRSEFQEIHDYLKNIATQIILDDGKTERVGAGCTWCVRAPVCESLAAAQDAGTIMTIMARGPEQAAIKLAELNAGKAAAEQMIPVLQTYLSEYMEDEQVFALNYGNVEVKVTPKQKRDLDSREAFKIIGPELSAIYGKMNLTVIDELLEGDDIDDEQKSKLRMCITEGVTVSTNARFKKK